MYNQNKGIRIKNPSKYHSKEAYFKGERFDSQKERDRWIYLCQLQKEGKISELQRQVKWKLMDSVYRDQKRKRGVIIGGCSYVADFQYKEDGELVIEDAKGYRTDVYILKRKWMYDKYGILIKEV